MNDDVADQFVRNRVRQEVTSDEEVGPKYSNGELKIASLDQAEKRLTATTTAKTYTIDEAVDHMGFGAFQWKLFGLTGLGTIADAMEMMILSILAPALHCDWLLEDYQQALITTFVFCGMGLSSPFWGKLCDTYGRKTSLILSTFFLFYFGALSTFSPIFIWLLILRGLVGFGIGGAPQSTTLFAEFLPSKHRAKCIVMGNLFWSIGTCFEVVLAILVMPTLGWRWLLGLSSLPLLVFFYVLLLVARERQI
jgi:MFS family permease